MGLAPSSYCANTAANEMEFVNCLPVNGDFGLITKIPFRGSHVRVTLDTLPYPKHSLFQARVSYTSWIQFLKDLEEEIATYPCLSLLPRCGRAFAQGRHQALYNVLAYYNKHLFHPMLIDAQMFVYRMVHYEVYYTSDGQGTRRTICDTQYLCFVVAPNREALLQFPRPRIGKSIGYANDYALCCPCCGVDFKLEDTLNLPETIPLQTPFVVPMHPQPQHSHGRQVMLTGGGYYGPSAISVDSVDFDPASAPPVPAAATILVNPSSPAPPAGYVTPVDSGKGGWTYSYP